MTVRDQNSFAIEMRERRFFLAMAIFIAVTAIMAFGMFYTAGYSDFSAPLWVHLHAATFMSWIFFYLVQNTLVLRNNLRLHRRLGWFGTGLASLMLLVGVMMAYMAIITGRNEGFTPPSFFALNLMNTLTFGALFFAAILKRRQTDWHRRLMLCSMICVIAPAFGRILILLEARTHIRFMLVILAYVLIAVIYDLISQRRIHMAYIWGFLAILGMGVAIEYLPAFPPFASYAQSIAS